MSVKPLPSRMGVCRCAPAMSRCLNSSKILVQSGLQRSLILRLSSFVERSCINGATLSR